MSQPPRLAVEIVPAPQAVQVALVGELDLSTTSVLDDALAPVLADPPTKLIFDLTALGFMDSSGIGVMLRAAQVVPSVGVRGASPLVSRILQATGLSAILPEEP